MSIKLFGKVCDTFDIQKVSGDVGIEVEVEFHEDRETSSTMMWNFVEDHSLRNGSEFVTRGPINIKHVRHTVDELYSHIGSIRTNGHTAVHVHLNCSQMTIEELLSFITLLLVVEEALVDMQRDDRKYNLFCLRTSHAELTLHNLCKSILLNNFRHIAEVDSMKYANINLAALSKFGSVEIRCMQTPQDRIEIVEWVELLHSIKLLAIEAGNPSKLLRKFCQNREELSATLNLPISESQFMLGLKNAAYVVNAYEERAK